MIDPYYEAQKWAYNTLTSAPEIAAANAGLENRIWPESPAPIGAQYPFITFADQGAGESQIINTDVAFFTIVLLIQGWIDLSNDDSSTAAAVSGAIYDALQRKNGVTDAARILSCTHQSPFRMNEEVSEGEWVLRHGHMFRIQVAPLGG